MSSDPNPARPDALAEAKARSQRLANAFVSVFGQERGRTPEQKLVVDHLATCAGEDGNSYQFQNAKDGISLIAAGIHRDGAKSLLLVIRRQLAIATKIFAPKKEPTRTKR
jgi:hypothetical protein